MKICLLEEFYEPYAKGGAQICAKFIAESLAEKGVKVWVLTPNLDKDETEIELRENLAITRFKSPLRRKILERGTSTSQNLQATGKKSIFDFIHHFYVEYSAWDIAKAFKKLHKKQKFDIVLANNMETTIALKHIKDPIRVAYLRDYRLLKHKFDADEYLACSKIIGEKIGKEHTVIYDPLEENKVSNLTKEEARKALKLPYKNIIVYFGSFIDEFDVQAIPEIAKELPDIHFVLGGNGPIKIKDSKNIHWFGFIPQDKIKDYWKAADLFFYPQKEDIGFGLKEIESMANETPLLCYKESRIELIEDGVNSFFTTRETLVEDIKKIFADKKKLEKISKEAKKIESDFNKQNVSDHLKNHLQSILS